MVAGQIMSNAHVARSTSEMVCNTLRQRIISHELPGGSRMVEAKVAKEMNVSITPVREAISRLANEGLVVVFPYKGTYVIHVTEEYVDDVDDLRRNLELMAAERGFSKLTDDDVAYLEQLCTESDIAFNRGDLFSAVRYDMMFHQHMFEISDSALLLEMWKMICYRIENIISYTKGHVKPTLVSRHGAMLNAMRSRDQEAYIEALKQHLHSHRQGSVFPAEADVQYE